MALTGREMRPCWPRKVAVCTRVRAPKDKPNAEGSVGNISTWITAALRNEQFFSLE